MRMCSCMELAAGLPSWTYSAAIRRNTAVGFVLTDLAFAFNCCTRVAGRRMVKVFVIQPTVTPALSPVNLPGTGEM